MPKPHLPALALAFCAGLAAPAASAQTLTGADWRVTTLVGVDLPPGVQPVLSFAAPDRVTGQAGCNRFFGTYTQDGLSLGFGALGATRMACDDARMAVEQRLFDALSATRRMVLTPGGVLELSGDSGLLVRAERP